MNSSYQMQSSKKRRITCLFDDLLKTLPFSPHNTPFKGLNKVLSMNQLLYRSIYRFIAIVAFQTHWHIPLPHLLCYLSCPAFSWASSPSSTIGKPFGDISWQSFLRHSLNMSSPYQLSGSDIIYQCVLHLHHLPNRFISDSFKL